MDILETNKALLEDVDEVNCFDKSANGNIFLILMGLLSPLCE